MANQMFQAAWDFVGRNAEQLVALLALFVAVGSLWLQREHNRLSVKPHLTTFTENDEEKRVTVVWLRNNGLGPALIRSFELRLDGKKKADGSSFSTEELVGELLKDVSFKSKRTQLGPGYPMPPNESHPLLEIELHPKEPLTLTDVRKRFERVELFVNYESFYGQAFVMDTTATAPSSQPLHPTPSAAEPPRRG